MKTRVISAIVVLAVLIPLLMIGGIPFAIGVGLISLLAYKEVIDLKEDLPFIVRIMGIISLLLLVYMTFDGYSLSFGISYKAVSLSMILLLLPAVFMGKEYTTRNAFYLMGFILLLGTFFNSLILIVNLNKLLLVYLLLITIMTDTFAMIIGNLIGRHKMIPSVSPKKSWEGALMGALMGTAIASMFYINIINTDINLLRIVGVTLILSIMGQLGDLIFSKIKRENNIKDFSNIMPGHGGILDRLDSIILVVLTFTIIFNIL